MNKPIVIGIAGGTGSGKTTLVNRLKSVLDDQVVTICHDYYYKANADMPLEERKLQNYDHPNAFETELMTEHLKHLKEGQTIHCPIYDFVAYTRKKECLEIKPKRVIIVEGILIFENKELVDELDIKVFVDTDADVRIIRRIIRDVKERGRSLDSVIAQYLTTVKYMHDEFVEPSKRKADVIIPEGGHNQVAVNMLVEQIRTLLR
jgi:uridine kinase